MYLVSVFICFYNLLTAAATVVVFLRRMLVFYSNLCVVNFFVSIK